MSRSIHALRYRTAARSTVFLSARRRAARHAVLLPLALLSILLAAPPVRAGQAPPTTSTDTKKADAATAKDSKEKVVPILTEDNEVKVGRENAEENDRQVKLVTDAAMVERVNRIGQEIAAVANKTPIAPLWGSPQVKQFHYSFKIVDDKDVNAYSLPGGFIYVNKGLLDYVHSDDELAGVLAHEISHAAHHHMMKLLREQNRMNRLLLPLQLLAVAAMATSRSNAQGASALLYGSQLYSIAKLNTYGIEAEKDADHSGILLLTHTKYNPVGLFSFMTRLAVDEQHKGPIELGIYRTHPPGEERAAAARSLLEELHIPIRLSEVDPKLKAVITLTHGGANGAELAEIRMRDVVICRIAANDGQTATERAQRIARSLNMLVDAQLQPFEIKPDRAQTKVFARGTLIYTEADATAQQKSISDLAREMSDAMAQYLLKQQMESGI